MLQTSPPVGSASAVGEPLSRREHEVLEMLAGPLTVTQIAAELFISPNTARTHVKSIFRKLGVHSRRDAVTRSSAAGPSTSS